MSKEDRYPISPSELKDLDAPSLLRELTLRDPSCAEGSAIYDLVNEVSNSLRQIRKTTGLTQAQLAERLDVSQGRISQIESGLPDHAPSLEMIARIGLACGLTPQVSFSPSASGRVGAGRAEGGASRSAPAPRWSQAATPAAAAATPKPEIA